ncbi:TolC family protein [Schlegelella sp. S2-27]|uniref:TolC family protein n=1 Tax=Caldimonas mangrovi TaxID=2944811 RepID=A0ABT0YQ47_9BURK|nr:TolC family protein [Caldimonas mangrovi]MCM5680372.1 TolC family protein [Caldimonas mangrovi]
MRLPFWPGPSAAAILGLAVAIGMPAGAAPGLTYEQALDAAERRAPSLAAGAASVDAAARSAEAAGQLPDPSLSVGLENLPVGGRDRFDWSAEPMTMRRLGWMQEVPNAAKRAAQRIGAQAARERERARWLAVRQQVRGEAAVAWLARHYAQRRLVALASVEREVALLVDTVHARVAAGTAMPADAAMARLEAAALDDRRDELQRQFDGAQAAFVRWFGEAEPAGDPPLLTVDALQLKARLNRHVELLPYEPMLAMSEAAVAQAQAERRGDWAWEVAYSNRSRAFGDMLSVQLRFQLPVSPSTRQGPRVSARQKDAERVRAEAEEARLRVAAELDDELAELRRLERALQRQRERVEPLVQERARLSLAAYQAGRADLGSVLAARRNAAEARLRTIELQSELAQQNARLSHLVTE